MLILLAIGHARAATVNVPSEYETLKEAVEQANAGDTIAIEGGWDGSTEEVVNIEKDLTIEGAADDHPSLPALHIEGADVEIDYADMLVVASQYSYAEGVDQDIALSTVAAAVTLNQVTFDGFNGVGIDSYNATLNLTDVDLTDIVGGVALRFDVTHGAARALTMVRGSMTGGSSCITAASVVAGSYVSLDGVDIADDGGNGEAWVQTSDIDVDVTSSTFRYSGSATNWSALYASLGTIALADTEFQNLSGGDTGVVAYIANATLTASNLTFSWPDHPAGVMSALELVYMTSVQIDGLTISDASTSQAPIVINSSGPVVLDNVVVTNSTGPFGGIDESGIGSFTLRKSQFCGSTASGATDGLGSIVYSSSRNVAVTGTMFVGNTSDDGILVVDGRGANAQVENVDFLSNYSPVGSIYSPTTGPSWIVVNTIFDAENLDVGALAATSLSAAYNDYYNNTYEGVFTFSSTDQMVDPLFVSAFSPSDCGSMPVLRSVSTLIDAGYGADTDGGNYDIGALSGAYPLVGPPDANDGDGDGYDSASSGGDDCDDSDGSVHPNAVDIPCDGIDQNCDGVNPCTGDTGDSGTTDSGTTDSGADSGGDSGDTGPAPPHDADGDGYNAEIYGGTDCDDTRAYVHPGAWDDPATSIDESCDGGNSTMTFGGGCGCAVGGDVGTGEAPDLLVGAVLLAGLVALKRRP